MKVSIVVSTDAMIAKLYIEDATRPYLAYKMFLCLTNTGASGHFISFGIVVEPSHSDETVSDASVSVLNSRGSSRCHLVSEASSVRMVWKSPETNLSVRL